MFVSRTVNVFHKIHFLFPARGLIRASGFFRKRRRSKERESGEEQVLLLDPSRFFEEPIRKWFLKEPWSEGLVRPRGALRVLVGPSGAQGNPGPRHNNKPLPYRLKLKPRLTSGGRPPDGQWAAGSFLVITGSSWERLLPLAGILQRQQQLEDLPLEQLEPPQPGSHWQVLGATQRPWTQLAAQ
ncbi:hypothetical protein EYF80_047065 [Liparis tanakae]|uniref:Uncharacterized protein n=1 Tax=Liparis tanakae TaxID=230148 RepID=A0A4Z2FNN0_9TELE|nr:hypothetical protein EYF80_047065 [Liparis tanakae]